VAETTIRVERIRVRVPAMERDLAVRLGSGLGPAIVERLAPSAIGVTPGHAWVARVEVPPIRSAAEPAVLRDSVARAVADSVAPRLPGRRDRR